MLILSNLKKSYYKKLFSSFSYKFEHGKIYAIIGPSGCGKSTLLNLISKLDTKYEGQIIYNNVDIKKMKNHTFLNVAYCNQSYQLFEDMTCLENVLLFYKLKKEDESKYIYKAKALFLLFDIEELINKKVKYLSGGEKQRVAIIKTLIKNSPIMLFDEPTSALDNNNQQRFMNQIRKIKNDKIIIIVTHDLSLANKCDEIIDFTLKNKMTLTIKSKEIKEKQIKFSNLKEIYKKVFKSKKIYSYLSSGILTFGLISASLSFSIKGFINQIIENSFSMFDTSNYITFKNSDNNIDIDFKNEDLMYEYVYYEGINPEMKKQIKNNSLVECVEFNYFKIEQSNMIFDNYLSSYQQYIVLYVPSIANEYIKEKNYLYIYYLNQKIEVEINKVVNSYDNQFYIYCNNINYLKKYFMDLKINVIVEKYYYSNESIKLYNHLISDNRYSSYLFYLDKKYNVILIKKGILNRISLNGFKEFIDKNKGVYIYSDYVHTYIDYKTGLMYLLKNNDRSIQIRIDENLKINEVGLSKKLNDENNQYQKYKIFDKFYEIKFVNNEDKYSIIYMNHNTFNNLNDKDLIYCGALFNNKNIINVDNIIINTDLFKVNNIKAFRYISDFILYVAFAIILLSILSTITIFTINYSSKKKDIYALKNMGIYKKYVLYLLFYEPLSNVISSSLSSVVFTFIIEFLLTFIYHQISGVFIETTVSVYLLICLLILPLTIIFLMLLLKYKNTFIKK